MSRKSEHGRSWWRRRSLFNVRNGRLVLLGLASIVMGVGATLVTAYLGLR